MLLENIKELFNYGVLGVFAAFVLWCFVKGGQAVYDVLFSPGDEKRPRGIIVRLSDQIQHNLEKNSEFMDRTAQVLISLETDREIQREQCGAHTLSMIQVASELRSLIDIHRDPNSAVNNEKTNRKISVIQQGMVGACILCKCLAATSKNPEIVQLAEKHCDAIIKALESEI